VLVGVHEHAVLAAEPATELVEALPEHGVAVMPRVTRKSPVALLERRLRRVVAVSRRHDGTRTVEQRLGMARDLGLRHREAHVGEQPAGLSLANVSLRLPVGGSRGRTDDVELQLLGEQLQLGGGHMRDCAQ